ncbi:hypothetical protein [Zooshikella harenae]|uniref:Uncharacterized protein n=1 Tax=Zooshikella harenae TaxID=2827238 RepID=A0ABS5ZL12_9GAMM|nr:hypothetical protein [Zooshikella harenae]MBU2713757.1 hypothetical protein [Zooshikella harenae]
MNICREILPGCHSDNRAFVREIVFQTVKHFYSQEFSKLTLTEEFDLSDCNTSPSALFDALEAIFCPCETLETPWPMTLENIIDNIMPYWNGELPTSIKIKKGRPTLSKKALELYS